MLAELEEYGNGAGRIFNGKIELVESKLNLEFVWVESGFGKELLKHEKVEFFLKKLAIKYLKE